MIITALRRRRSPKGHRVRKLVGGVAALLLAAGFGVVSAPPASAVDGSVCDFGAVLTVRGTGQAPGAGLAHGNRVWVTGGHGSELESLAWWFKASSPLPMFVASVNYPAAGDATYFNSVMTGRANLVNEINWLAEQCGNYTPAIMLAGYSQGGAVVMNSLLQVSGAPNLSARAKDSIRAVVVFGDPNFSVNQPWNAPGSPTNVGGLMGPHLAHYNAQFATYKAWGWPMGSSFQGWVHKIRSYCYHGDTFCNSGTGPNAIAIHNSYGENSTTAARDWMEYMVNAF